MADRGQQARLQTTATQRDAAAVTRQKEEAENGGEKKTLEQSHSAGEKLTYGALIRHEELHFVRAHRRQKEL